MKRSAPTACSSAKRQCGGGQPDPQPAGCSHWPSPAPPASPSTPPALPTTPQRYCNWCGRATAGPSPYCARCATAGRECRTCHRPMPDRFFAAGGSVCHACTHKRAHTRERFGDVLATHYYDVAEAPDLQVALHDHRTEVMDALAVELLEKRSIKLYLSVELRMSRFDVDGSVHTATPTLRSDIITIMTVDDIEGAVDAAIACLNRRLDAYMAEGSGWTLDAVLVITVHIAAYQPLHGATYLPTPEKLAARKAIVNVCNYTDNKCFMWSVLAALHPVDRNTSRISNYVDFESELNMAGIAMPVALKDVDRFETQNAVSVNVFGYEGVVYPLRITELRDRSHVNLLLLADGVKRHYVLIKNLSRLIAPRAGHEHTSFPCDYCLHVFCRADLLADHVPHCKPHGPQRIKMPSGDDTSIFFTHEENQLRVPFIVYADFECFTEPIDTCKPGTTSYTHPYQRHTPSGYGFHVVSDHPGYISKPVVYRGPDVVDNFLSALRYEHRLINATVDCPVPMVMSEADKLDFASATTCHICGKEGTQMVRDHDHLTGAYRGAAHNKCNLRLHFKGKKAKGSNIEVPVVFHNLRGYDAHLIAPALGRHPGRINVIANNMTKYISFSLGKLRFIDSLQFMSASLEKLVANLPSDAFTNLEAHTVHSDLLKRKGVFPYDHFDGPARLVEKDLPPQSAFHSRLTDTDIGDDDYAHAQEVWTTFGMSSFADYHDLYLLTDVLLLADVFEQFRSTCMTHYGLDPAHYYTAPGLSWDAMLKMTEVELELLTDVDMHLFIESGIRGGVSMISGRHAVANNAYVPDYDSSRPTTHIIYLDANNLYGTVMSEHLPISDFRWLDVDEVNALDVATVGADADTGYIMEVDLEYPHHLHDLHCDYPLAPERLQVEVDMLSPYSQHLRAELGGGGVSSRKLVPNLRDKTHYVLHYRNLQQCLGLGMKLTAVHRVLAFTQSAWLEPYIQFNTEQRKKAVNSFEKDFFKLLNNAIFGKTMENLRKRTDIKLVSDSKAIRKYCARPQLHAFQQFESVAAIHLLKTELVLNRPIYAGFTILELSKRLMYEFHYGYVKSKYDGRARLLFTDTDSLCYEIATADVYADMLADAHQFDTSDYPTDHPNFSLVNKKVLGKFKDETAGRPILEFVGLRPKMYSILLADSEKKTAKGVARCVRDRDLKHNLYRDCLLGERMLHHEMNAIRSFNHHLYSITLRKTTLSPFDDKRFVLDDKVSTRAHGHFRNALE